jgi:CRP/FNR family transcriptional regulator, cyclic AMP receptor protein
MAGAPPELLDRVPLFSGLDRRQRAEIAGSMKGRSLAAGDTIAVEGEKGVGFFVIESGTAGVSVGGEERRKLGPGDYFGEIALLSQAARSATVTAETPVQCWGLTSWDFRPIVQKNASVAWSLLESLAKMLSAEARSGTETVG